MLASTTVSALSEARRHCTATLWKQMIDRITASEASPTRESIAQITRDLGNPHTAWLLSEAFLSSSDVKWIQIAGAMVAIDHLIGQKNPAADFIWTGPANGRFPVRRIDQVLYDLIAVAQQRILLVTFAAHRIQYLCKHVSAAVSRGIQVTLIVETEEESEGQLSVDAIRAFKELPLERLRILYWPNENRGRNEAGRPGKLHAKCAIVDDTAIIVSANFTDDAFNRNIELGVILREPALAELLFAHFVELDRKNTLRVLKLNG
jgi:cardiolipin synthase A/B